MAEQKKQEKSEGQDLMEKITSLCKRRGFIFQGSEIYGGLAGTWDFGPLGVALKNNIKNSWRKKFVSSRDDMYEVDAALLMNAKVWETSGHVGGFADPLIECINCRKRYRVDQLVDEGEYSNFLKKIEKIVEDSWNKSDFIYSEKFDIDAYTDIAEAIRNGGEKEFFKKIEKSEQIALFLFNDLRYGKKFLGTIPQFFLAMTSICPNCKTDGKVAWGLPFKDRDTKNTGAKQFNMMFSTKIGAMEDSASTVYFRPETAQGMFVNFKNILDAYQPKLPFGMAQIGKAFRNEITPRDFIFRVREFEQMEIEYFIREKNWETEFEKLRVSMHEWMDEIGIDKTKVHELKVTGDDLAHYSKATTDFEFDFPFGRKELYGLAYRTDFDLKAHMDASGVSLEYFDQDGETDSDKKFIPHVIEPSFGVERTVLALLTSAYCEDEQNGELRSYLKFKPSMAPVVCAVSPLLKNRPELQIKAREVFAMLKQKFGNVMYDDNGNVGKRYRRQDEIGTPWCVVIDFETLGQEIGKENLKDTVTIRDRDSGKQTRVAISELVSYLESKM